MVRQTQQHPDEKELALYSTSDLNLVDRLRVGWHLRSCAHCAREVDTVAATVSEIRSRSEAFPAAFEWDRLAAEMTANIHLGWKPENVSDVPRSVVLRGSVGARRSLWRE